MIVEDSIPESLRDAFGVAAYAVRDWFRFGGEEPEVMLDGVIYPVSEVCDMAEIYSDLIPPDGSAIICDLCRQLHRIGPADPSYGTHAQCLGEVCRFLRKQNRQQLPRG